MSEGHVVQVGPTRFPLPGLQTAVFSLYPHMLASDQSGRKQALRGLFLPGIEYTSLAVKAPSANHRTARELPVLSVSLIQGMYTKVHNYCCFSYSLLEFSQVIFYI